MSQENLRAAVIAASSMWPEAYRLKQFGTFTSQQTMEAIYARAEEIAAWLDARELFEVDGVAMMGRRDETGKIRFANNAAVANYQEWLNANRLNDTAASRDRWYDEVVLQAATA